MTKPLTVERSLQQLACLLGFTDTTKGAIQFRIQQVGMRIFSSQIRQWSSDEGVNEESVSPALLPPMPASNPNWKWLSITEEAIVRNTPAKLWTTLAQIAEAAGLPHDRDLEAIFRNLVDRGILESKPGRGYRLNEPPC